MSFVLPFESRQPHISHNITDSFDRPILGFSAINLRISSIFSSVISGLLNVFILDKFDTHLLSPVFFINFFNQKKRSVYCFDVHICRAFYLFAMTLTVTFDFLGTWVPE